MLKKDIHVGGFYLAKVSNNVVPVRVDAISYRGAGATKDAIRYDITNMRTKRTTTFRSATKFRCPCDEQGNVAMPATKRKQLQNAVADYDALPTPTEEQTQQAEAAYDELTTAAIAEAEVAQEQAPFSPASASTPASSPASAVALTAEPAATPLTERPSTASSLGAALARAKTASNGDYTPPHVIVVARAGSGKTTTLVEGLKEMRGIGSKLTPSPQQRAVWDAICQSRDARSVCFVAFNKSIATELQQRVPQGCDAMTMHSLGYKAVRKAWGRVDLNEYVVADHVCDLLGMDSRDARKEHPVLLQATVELVGLCKMNLVHPWDKNVDFEEALSSLASHHDVETNGCRDRVFQLVPDVLQRCRDPRGRIDFDDMIWLPVAHNLPVFRYDLLLVDEAQDLNRCQQALAKAAGRRLILCGDPKQAIYGFAGADAESMERMACELSGIAGEDGEPCPSKPIIPKCVILPLTVTRRCGKAIVEEARSGGVTDFEAHETCPPGKVTTAAWPIKEVAGAKTEVPWEQSYCGQVKVGDMVLCRVNAPLVGQCFRFLRRGIKANIQGRDVGRGLASLVKKMKARDVPDLIGKLSDWLAKEQRQENAKRNPSENKLIALEDKHDCVVAFCEGQTTVDDVLAKIDSVFTDNKDCPGVRFSSIHKAKGLEADNVFFLMPKGAACPHPMAKKPWAVEQEHNLLYVGRTRAIHTLTYVS